MSTMSRRRAIARRCLVAGLVAGAAMVPFGMALRAAGRPVNVYGELLVRALLGSAPPVALAALHVAVSVSLAAPFVLASERRRLGPAWGVGYGVASWALVNATVLPLWFSRPTAWSLGPAAAWPSLLVHAVYGLVLGLWVARDQPPSSP